MPQTTANADAILRDYYIGPVREQLNQRAILMFASVTGGQPDNTRGERLPFRGLSRDAEGVTFAGRKWVVPAHTQRNEAVGAILEGGALPEPGQQGWEDLSDTLKHNVGVIGITRYAIDLSNRQPGTFLRFLKAETEGMTKDLRKDVSRQAYGNGTGTLAAVTADGARAFTVDTIQYLRVGMWIDVIDSTNDTALATRIQITRIDPTTLTVDYSGSDLAVTTDHRICRTGSWKKEINGLANLISDTGTVHGVDSTVATNWWWKSTVRDARRNQFSEDLGQQVLDSIGSAGNGDTEILLTTRGIRRRYVNQLKSQKRFTDNQSVVLHGGFRAIMFNEFPLVFDDDCPKGMMYFLNTDGFMWVTLPGSDGNADWNWVDNDGAILSRSADRTDRFEAYVAADHDLAITQRNIQGVISNLQDDVAGAWN